MLTGNLPALATLVPWQWLACIGWNALIQNGIMLGLG